MKKFWKWKNKTLKNEEGTEIQERVLVLNGTIADESWYGDEITPGMFKDELMQGTGNITVWINSPGGDCIAASQIYTMLMEYKGDVTVKIDGLAASAASVIAMAGGKILMSTTAVMMIHNPFTMAVGEAKEFKTVIQMLDEIKESIINAYELKTSMARDKISKLMDNETWLNANKAVELGFADEIMYERNEDRNEEADSAFMFATKTAEVALCNKIKQAEKIIDSNPEPKGLPVSLFEKRLKLLEH